MPPTTLNLLKLYRSSCDFFVFLDVWEPSYKLMVGILAICKIPQFNLWYMKMYKFLLISSYGSYYF